MPRQNSDLAVLLKRLRCNRELMRILSPAEAADEPMTLGERGANRVRNQ